MQETRRRTNVDKILHSWALTMLILLLAAPIVVWVMYPDLLSSPISRNLGIQLLLLAGAYSLAYLIIGLLDDHTLSRSEFNAVPVILLCTAASWMIAWILEGNKVFVPAILAASAGVVGFGFAKLVINMLRRRA